MSIDDLSANEIEFFLQLTSQMRMMASDVKRTLLAGKILGSMFFEPSTRTRLSFESAMIRLGGSVIGFSDATNTSTAKGESLVDTVKTVEKYADILVIRHPKEGAARLAAEQSQIPVINAGDGSNQHPSQTLLDLYTIGQSSSLWSALTVAFVGDLRYSRTIPPLIRSLIRMRLCRFILVAPEALRMSRFPVDKGVSTFEETSDLRAALAQSDIVYVSRVQKERFADPLEYERVKDSYSINAEMLTSAKPTMRLLHPLPRVNEIHPDVDVTPHAAYFDQVEFGTYVRQALLFHYLGGKL